MQRNSDQAGDAQPTKCVIERSLDDLLKPLHEVVNMLCILQTYIIEIAVAITIASAVGAWRFRHSLFPIWFPRFRLRRIVTCIPGERSGDESQTANWHCFELHHDGGESFRVDGCHLAILFHASTPDHAANSDKDKRVVISYALMEPQTSEERPLFEPGTTFCYAAALPLDRPWDRIDMTKQFAAIMLTSQGKSVQYWDVSDELGPAIDILREWQASSQQPATMTPQMSRVFSDIIAQSKLDSR